MTPLIAADLGVLDEPLACMFSGDQSQIEVDTLGRSLDILAPAVVPGAGEIQVAIENQYGVADPDHFGRLVGWYMPETGSEMGVLIAEDFEPQLIRSVQEGQIIRPEHGLFLVRADGFKIGEDLIVHYTMVASSLDRVDWIRRQQRFRQVAASGGSVKTTQGEIAEAAAVVFRHLRDTSAGWLNQALANVDQRQSQYRWLADNGDTCHIALGVAQNRISVGSCYLKSGHDPQTLELLEEARLTPTDPPPSTVYLRGVWWDIADVGYQTEKLPDDLGAIIEARIDAIRSAIDAHQDALLSVASAE